MLLPDAVDPVEPRRTRWQYITQALSCITIGLQLPQNLTDMPGRLRAQDREREGGIAGSVSEVGVTAMDTESTHDALSLCRRYLVLLKGFIRGI